jgi:predicted Zn-dependent peptidase
VAAQLAFVDEYGLGDEFLNSYVRRVLSVTPDQIRSAANVLLTPSRMQLVVVGDKKTVEQQISGLGKIVP